MRYIALGCFSLLLAAGTANADWLEASSDHFVIYTDQSDVAARRFAERLERYHAAMAHVYARKDAKPGPSNRVTVFILPGPGKVRQVLGIKSRSVAGMYIPRAGACVALVSNMKGGSTYQLTGEAVLLHEYAHHFMIATLTARAYPRWFIEGFAEFFGSVRFKDEGVVLGAPAAFRAPELVYGQEVPIRTLLSFDGGWVKDLPTERSSFYGQSWLLFHYLQMAPERAGQLASYQHELATGHEAVQAAESAFGDLAQLEKNLDAYMKRKRLAAMLVPETALTIGPVIVRVLRPGEAEMMPVMLESKAGVDHDEALALVPEARRVAALFPKDPAVLAALAEAEFDAGNDDAAIAAADGALAIDPQQINAHIQKGYALTRKVESGALPEEAWKDVRAQFIKANAIENDHPIPLLQFYLTYKKQGEQPTKNAIAALERAMQLAPFDGSLRMLVATQMISDERYQDAARTLGPLAYSPHPGESTDAARQLLKEVEGKLAGQTDATDSAKAE